MKPKMIDKYRIQERVGKGTFGDVHKGVNTKTNEEVALKFIKKKEKKSSEIKTIKAETDLLRKINHPNIIALKDCLETSEEIIIVTQLADGDLYKILQRQIKFPYERVRKYSREILSAMLYLHENRILHRDLKPQNILVKNGSLKLCDFGFAKKLSASTNFVHSFKGTPLYIAPQIIRQLPHTHKVDIWAFGIIIYQLLYGKTPFHSTSMNELTPKILNKKVQYPVGCKAQFRQLIDGMLQKNPKMRYDWQDVKRHRFFKEEEDNPPEIAKQTSHVELETEPIIEEEHKPSKPIIRMNSEEQINQLKEEMKLILSDRSVAEEYKTNIIFYHKLLNIIGHLVIDKANIPKELISKMLSVIIHLIRKVELPHCKLAEDITRKQELMVALIKLAEIENNYQLLFQQLVVIGVILKLTFNQQSINFDLDENITSLITDILKRNDLPLNVLENCLKVLAILALQGMQTIKQSYPFFMRVIQEKILTQICSYYRPNLSHRIVLECLQKFVAPTQKFTGNAPQQYHTMMNNMRQEVSAQLLRNGFISSVSPIEIYYKNKEPQTLYIYMQVLVSCIQESAELRVEFKKHGYWNDLIEIKKMTKKCLALNYLMTELEGYNFIKKETIQKQVVNLDESKNIKLYLLHLLHLNFKSKRTLIKTEAIVTALQQIYETLIIEDISKISLCTDIFGMFVNNCTFFNEVLLSVYAELINGNYANQKSIEASGVHLMEKWCLMKQNLVPSRISIKSYYHIITLSSHYPHLLKNVKSIEPLMDYTQYLIKSGKLAEIHEKPSLSQYCVATGTTKGHIHMMQRIIELVLHYLMLRTEQDIKQHYIGVLQSHSFERIMFLDAYVNEQILPYSLQLMTLIMLPESMSIYDYFVCIVLPKIKAYLQSNENIIYNLIQIISQIAKKSSQYYETLKEINIIKYVHIYLHNYGDKVHQKTLHLIGNLSKLSPYFFDLFHQHGIISDIHHSLNSYPNNPRILKNAVFAIGNITYYTDRFNMQFVNMFEYIATALKSEDDHMVHNTLSTLCNLLRHSATCMQELYIRGIYTMVLEIIRNGKSQNINVAINFIRKSVKYQEFYERRYISKEDTAWILEKRKDYFSKDEAFVNKLRKAL